MKSYMALKAEIAKLERQAEAARRAEVAEVVRKIKDAVAAYGLTAADLGLDGAAAPTSKPVAVPAGTRRVVKAKGRAKAAKRAAKATIGEPKYRDPATGKTWTGRGKPPTWIAGAQDRGAFLITVGAPTATAAEPAKTEAKPARKTRTTAKAKAAGKTKAAAATKPESPAKPKRAAAKAGRGRKKAARKAAAPASETNPAIAMESTAAQ